MSPWLQAQRTLLETWQAAPQVMAIRLMWLSTPPFLWSGTQQAEMVRMVAEKQMALSTGLLAMSGTLSRGMLDPINSGTLPARLLSAGLRPAHRKVRSNLARLGRHHARGSPIRRKR